MGYMQKSRSNARAVALGGMLSALAVAFMSIGSIVPSLDMSSAFIAGIVVIVARLEINRTAPVSVYLVAGILSFFCRTALREYASFASTGCIRFSKNISNAYA